MMDRERRRELLRSSPYFARIDAQLLDEVAGVMQERGYGPGERIFSEGDDEGAAALHFVESGTVRIFKLSTEGREQVLRLMRPGDSFADVPVFDGGPYPANADALEFSVVATIPRKALQRVLREHPEIALGALQVMAARLRHMTGLVEDLSLRRVMARVARLLQEHPNEMHLTQSQMAAMVGTAREMVNRSLHTLSDQGVVELHGQSIHIKDRDALARIVESG
jgi:CRP/FNR family transcriptional regulator